MRKLKVGMAVHCKTPEQAWELVRVYAMPAEFAYDYWDRYKENTCYIYGAERGDGWTFCRIGYALEEGFDIVEFNELSFDGKEEKPSVFDSYVVCELMTGEVLDFDKLCNEPKIIDGDSLVKFMCKNEKTGMWVNLAVIPVVNIKCIKYVHSCEVINKVISGLD